MQRLIILRGPPASGKSTIAKKLRNFETKVAWLKVDNFKPFFADDASSALTFVNGAATATLVYLLHQDFSVVMEGVFQDVKAVYDAVQVANGRKIPVKVFELDVPLETLQTRDSSREGVPENRRPRVGNETIEKIHDKLIHNPYAQAIFLDTEKNNLQKCIEIINDSF